MHPTPPPLPSDSFAQPTHQLIWTARHNGKMPWPWQSGSASAASSRSDDEKRSLFSTPNTTNKPVSWNDSLHVDHYKDPRTWVPAFVVTTVLFGALKFYRVYLRRIPSIQYIHPDKYRRRTLFGKVTSVGDGDGFHFFHTPGGRWAGWGWLRTVPTDKKALKGNTMSIRLAGIDAPEGAHFGRPAQPYSAESLQWLQSKIIHRYVRLHIYRRDQYERVVATAYMRRLLFFRTDVGLEMLHRGLATTYEAKSGAEFGGEKMEQKYRDAEAEAKRKGLGLWSALGGKSKGWFGLGTTKPSKEPFETPREFKDRMRDWDKAEKGSTK
ncbi:Arp complex subunit [Gnomoniopsis sp. IMI 355080]|nr:Arp complex subunit [Gnomoniopsis sp. IMI 355080]